MNPLTKRLLALGASSVIAITGGYLVGPYEGKRNNAYLDMVGIPTICWGWTKSVKLGDYKTNEECDKQLAEELTKYNKNMKRNVTVPLKEYEEIAYTSFVWNIGETKWNSSTLLKKLNAGDSIGACKELLRWNKATFNKRTADVQIKNGESCSTNKDGSYSCSVKGLTNRRVAEYNVCTNQNAEVSDALEALRVAQEAPLNVDQGGSEYNILEPLVAPVETAVQSTLHACKVNFSSVCFWKGK